MRIAVVGGGVFGCTAAAILSRAGNDVHLFEHKTIMSGASGSSFYRLHRGYHYPRSPVTGWECRQSEEGFRNEFGAAVIDEGSQWYGVAETGHVTADEYVEFLESCDLPYHKIKSKLVRVPDLFQVHEPRIDERKLADLLHRKLYNVKVHEGTPLPDDAEDLFDVVVIATYTNINDILKRFDLPLQKYKFQVVEKPILQMPSDFDNLSIVVIDGPFCCLDPMGKTDLHVLGHVEETILEQNEGYFPNIPKKLQHEINVGVRTSLNSNIKRIIKRSSEFIPALAKAEHLGSMFTVRAHLVGVEDTDARPTIVNVHSDGVVSIFSGKIGTAVMAAKALTAILGSMDDLLLEEEVLET